MATMITSECINCGACEPECPNTAIYQGGVEWELNGKKHPALATEIFYIVPEKCTECVGFFDHEACAAVCPVDCCIPNPEIPETEEQLIARAKVLHPEASFGSDFPSRFREEGAVPSAPAASSNGESAPVAESAVRESATETVPSFSIPAADDWEVPIDCFTCEGSYAVPFKHIRSGVVLRCPFCTGSYVVTTELYGRVSRALSAFHDRWSRDFRSFQERRQRELEEFEERQRRTLEDFNDSLKQISRATRAPGAPRKRAWIFG